MDTQHLRPRVITTQSPSTLSGIAALELEYVAHLKDSMAEMEQLMESIRREPERTDCLHRLHLLTNRISGTAGCFGLTQVSEAAREMESEIRVQRDRDMAIVVPSHLKTLSWLMDDLTNGVNRCHSALMAAGASLNRREKERPVVVIGDHVLEALSREFAALGYAVAYFRTPDEFLEQRDFVDPLAFIHRLNATVSATGETLRHYVQAQGAFASAPYLAVIAEENLDVRLKAVAEDADGIFVEPLAADQFFSYLTPPLGGPDEEPTHVVIIEDDPFLQRLMQLALRPLNCSVITSNGRDGILQSLHRHLPDIVLVDSMLDGMDGYTIFRMLQIDRLLQSKTIRLLVTQGDEMERIRQWELGSSYIIPKPFDINYLTTHLRHEMVKLRSGKKLSVRDGLTGLYNRAFFEEMVTHELARGQRYNSHFSLVLLDIDNFSAVNRNLGEETGDRVLRQFAGVLSQVVRGSDLVARVGGDEFGLLVLGVQPQQAAAMVDRLSGVFHDLVTKEQDPPVTLNLSAVIYSFPEHVRPDSDIFHEAYRVLKAQRRRYGWKLMGGAPLES